jgi:bifunctional UDP-N-acetylglucosamine pyrophosphorylase / glucosamine-1-phosphate N-acetyltransferase
MTMAKRSCLAIILAAGEGTRMKSAIPKVLHPVGGLPMLGHVLRAAADAGATRTAVIVGAGADVATAFIEKTWPPATVHVQAARLGTAHAVLAAKTAIAEATKAGEADDVLVLFADTPLMTAATMHRIRELLAAGSDMVFPGFRPPDPTGYGRLIVEKGRVVAIREEKDASPAERKIDYCWPGIAGFRGGGLLATLLSIGNANAKGEYYLTEAVELANRAGQNVGTIEIDADEVAGVNDRLQLAHVEGSFQRRMREAAMAAGVTMIAPKTVWFSYDTRLGRDVTIEPNVFFGPGVTVADNVSIRANCHLEGAHVESGAVVGPFARLRPGARIGANAHIGNFVEVKNAEIGDGTKANHLAYIGDAHVGAGTNIGAGTITANYDGFDKHRTEIGANVSIGANSVLVAPVTVGDGASVAAGSVITANVPADALAVARGRQEVKPDWAKKFKERKVLQRNRIETKSR